MSVHATCAAAVMLRLETGWEKNEEEVGERKRCRGRWKVEDARYCCCVRMHDIVLKAYAKALRKCPPSIVRGDFTNTQRPRLVVSLLCIYSTPTFSHLLIVNSTISPLLFAASCQVYPSIDELDVLMS